MKKSLMSLGAGVVLVLFGCAAKQVGEGPDRAVLREQRCRGLVAAMRLAPDARASSERSVTEAARMERDYQRYQCSDFERD